MAAYVEVCPERVDMIHPHFRKFCKLLADLDEWGQIVMLNQLTRYARTQFSKPPPFSSTDTSNHTTNNTKNLNLKDFYAENDQEDSPPSPPPPPQQQQRKFSPDHKLLLRSALPLLRSRNSGVIVAVTSTYFYLGTDNPKTCRNIANALIRDLQNHREIAFVILQNIAQVAEKWPDAFRENLNKFYVNVSDATFSRDAKLRVLLCLTNESNVTSVLRELQNYCKDPDDNFVVKSIRTVGHVAEKIPKVSDRVLRGLMMLIRGRSEKVVDAAVVVIRQLLRCDPSGNKDAIQRLVVMLQNIEAPAARSCIVWMVGEFAEHIEHLAPDALRVLAKRFSEEHVNVKMQILNMSLKLFSSSVRSRSSSSDVITKLFRHVVELAKYDMDFDLRDRARLISGLLLESSEKQDMDILTAVVNKSSDFNMNDDNDDSSKNSKKLTQHHNIGSISALLNRPMFGYMTIPEWTDNPTNSSVRDPEVVEKKNKNMLVEDRNGGFYSDSQSDGSSLEGSSSDSSSSSSSQEDNVAFYSDDDDDDDDDDDYTDDSDESGSSSSSSSDEVGSDSEDEQVVKKLEKNVTPKQQQQLPEDILTGELFLSEDKNQRVEKNENQADDESFDLLELSVMDDDDDDDDKKYKSDVTKMKHLLLPASHGHGALKIEVIYLREQSSHGKDYDVLDVLLHNIHDEDKIRDLSVRKKDVPEDMSFVPFREVGTLLPKSMIRTQMYVAFRGNESSIRFSVHSNLGSSRVELKAPLGELLRPVSMTIEEFVSLQQKMGGLQEASCKVKTMMKNADMELSVLQKLRVSSVMSKDDSLCFSGKRYVSVSDHPVLLFTMMRLDKASVRLSVNCENAVMSSIYLKVFKGCFVG